MFDTVFTDITDRAYMPELSELCEYVGGELFRGLCALLQDGYKAHYRIDYSGDNNLPGWNVRFYKSGRTLCRLYPGKNEFKLLIVIGRREKEAVQAVIGSMSEKIRGVYDNTAEGMGQRWLIFSLSQPDSVYEDILKLIEIRRKS